jgi:nitrite reductase/ring-hydroxylating ferredoxin subunit
MKKHIHGKFVRFLLLTAVITTLSAACSKDEPANEIPYVNFSFSLDPNNPQYDKLNAVGGWETVVGGYNGILIYRKMVNEFVAFERACPYDPLKSGAQVRVESSGTICYCPVCNSRYIMTDGTPIAGPSRYTLRQYQAVYDGSLLYISN